IPDLGIDYLKGGPSIVGEGGTPDKGTLRGTAVGGPDARTVTFRVDRAGVFPFMCNLPYNRELNYCNPMHDRIIGQLVVLSPTRRDQGRLRSNPEPVRGSTMLTSAPPSERLAAVA